VFARGVVEQVCFVQDKMTSNLDAASEDDLTQRAYGQPKLHSETPHGCSLLFPPESKSVGGFAVKIEVRLPERVVWDYRIHCCVLSRNSAKIEAEQRIGTYPQITQITQIYVSDSLRNFFGLNKVPI
jgi:hypothetical protein